jgi:FtsZ-binding cell division protein ZapB
MSSKVAIESIAKLAERLIEQNRKLRAELEKAAASRERTQAENRRLMAENAALQRRLTVRELAEGFAGGREDGAKRARARVGRLVREVDRCLALVNGEGGGAR